MTQAIGSSSSPTDLTTVAAAASWGQFSSLGQTFPAASAANLQGCISAASIEFLRLTGRGPQTWQTPAQSPFVQPVVFSEVYDGNGNDELFLRNFPINSVSSLSLYGNAILASTSSVGPGFQIGNSGRSIVLVNGSFFIGRTPNPYPGGCVAGRGFPRGRNNVQVVYTAGFNQQTITNELQTIPANPTSLTVLSIANGYNWLTDGGVSYFANGSPLIPVLTAPAQGQYYLQSPGVYLFNAADAGAEVLISYTAAGTPPDIVVAVNQMVALNYKRRSWIGQSSVAMKDVGSTSYTMKLDPEIMRVIQYYERAK